MSRRKHAKGKKKKMKETQEVPEVKEEEKVLEPEPTLESELETLRNELEESKLKYLHLLAESENARKRMQKERDELTKFAVEQVIVEFLYPLDQMEKALSFTDQMTEEVKNWATGFQMILTQFKDVLSQRGIDGYDTVGKEFDPHWHEAVETFETEDHPPGTVLEEFVRGYKMGDRIIRPAHVKVSQAPKLIEEDTNQDNNQETQENQKS